MARKIALADLVTAAGLRRLAGEQYFERGVAEYFRRGLVGRLRFPRGEVGKPTAFPNILERLCREHRANRTFIELLDALVQVPSRDDARKPGNG